VNEVLLAVVVGAGLVLAVLAGLAAGLGKAPGRLVVAGAAFLELLVIVLCGWSVVAMIRGERPGEFLTFILYLVGVLVVMPIAIVWAAAEPTRWSNVVIAVGALTVMAMAARMDQIWKVTAGG